MRAPAPAPRAAGELDERPARPFVRAAAAAAVKCSPCPFIERALDARTAAELRPADPVADARSRSLPAQRDAAPRARVRRGARRVARNSRSTCRARAPRLWRHRHAREQISLGAPRVLTHAYVNIRDNRRRTCGQESPLWRSGRAAGAGRARVSEGQSGRRDAPRDHVGRNLRRRRGRLARSDPDAAGRGRKAGRGKPKRGQRLDESAGARPLGLRPRCALAYLRTTRPRTVWNTAASMGAPADAGSCDHERIA